MADTSHDSNQTRSNKGFRLKQQPERVNRNFTPDEWCLCLFCLVPVCPPVHWSTACPSVLYVQRGFLLSHHVVSETFHSSSHSVPLKLKSVCFWSACYWHIRIYVLQQIINHRLNQLSRVYVRFIAGKLSDPLMQPIVEVQCSGLLVRALRSHTSFYQASKSMIK